MSHSSWVVHSDKALEQLIQEKVLKRIMIPSFENNKCLRQETASRRFFQKDPQLQEFWDPPSLEHPLVVVPNPSVLLVVANSFQNLLHRRSFFSKAAISEGLESPPELFMASSCCFNLERVPSP